MPADRLLETLLRSLQTWTDQQDTPRLLGTAASLLTTLTNPLNIQLLVSQLLSAPAIWERPDGLRTCQRVMGLFHSAALAILQHERDVREGAAKPPLPGQMPVGGGMPTEDWVTAVVRGADERSPRWKHLLVLGGLLLGSGADVDCRLAGSLEAKLQNALVQATNLALLDVRDGDELGAHCIALVLNHVFPVLSEAERAQVDYDHLLPVLIGAAFFSNEGFQSAYFLGTVDLDVVEEAGQMLNWSSKLSAVDLSEESVHFHQETIRTTSPLLWRILKAALFATVIVLRGALGRMLGDGALAADGVAPVIVGNALHILRNLYFITSRIGAHAFSQHTFVYLTSIDVLTQYPIQADAFLKAIRPETIGSIPKHPLDRCQDLYFLNTAEHFTLVLSPQTNEELLVSAATPYLSTGGSSAFLPIFEAAHSVMLSVLSAPSSARQVAAKHLPFYVSSLFAAFPTNLSPRQFRLAFKTLLRVTAPPSPLSSSQPDLPATLCELVHHRAISAPATPLPTANLPAPGPENVETVPAGEPPLSEQAVLVLTLIDALPILPVPLLEEWLPLCADLTNQIQDMDLKGMVRRRFWEVLVGGEMDPERSMVAVSWWSTRGGREKVMFGDDGSGNGEAPLGNEEEGRDKYLMSGALPASGVMEEVEEGKPRESKL
ncbi:hypothetical protein SLS56_007260 [Neofusicoccum ribis]|uniref:Peroxisomal membrane protein Pex17 n=1 Tax=Neofusicoccum ribis TaxID=45134 RepID=A0ABR3SNI4_9PEZI